MSKGLVLLLTSILLHFATVYPNTPKITTIESDTRFIITDGHEVSTRYINEDQTDAEWRIGDLFPVSFGQNFPSDPSFMGILIKDADVANGKWYYKNRNSTQWVNITLNNYLVNVDDHLRFVPNLDYYSANPILLTASLYIVGGEHSDPFSDAADHSSAKDGNDDGLILQVFVNPVNDAPTIKLGTENQYIQVGVSDSQKGWKVANLFENSFDDRKDEPNPGSFAGIMVTGVDNTAGIWEYRINEKMPWLQINYASPTYSMFLNKDVLIRFTTTRICDENNNRPSATLKARMYEDHAGKPTSSGSMHDISNYNPTGYFSLDEVNLTVKVLCNQNPSLVLNDNQWKVYTGQELYVDPVSITNIGGNDELPIVYEYVKDGITTNHALSVGTYHVTAKTVGNSINNPAQSNTIIFTVRKVTPILTLSENQSAIYTGGNLYIPPAVASNVVNNVNLPITYRYEKDGVTTDHALNAGVYTVTAETVGDGEHFGVHSNPVQFTVERSLTGITFDPIQTKVIGSAPFNLNMPPVANQSIIYKSSDESIAEISANGTVTMKKVGSITITVITSGDENHLPASVSQGLNIIKATPILTLGNTPSKVYTGSPLHADPAIVSNVINNATLPVTYWYVKNGVATDFALNAGTYTVTAKTVGNEEHFAAESNLITFIVEKAPSIINFPKIEAKIIGSEPFGLNVSANGNQKIIYKSSDESVAEVSANGIVTVKQSGSVIITATIANEENYLPASESQALEIISDYIKLYIDNKEWDINERYIVDDKYTGNTLGVEIELALKATINIDKIFTVDISKPGVINIYFTTTSQNGATKDYHLEIEKCFLFSSFIVQKWNNTLAVNNNPNTNGGYKFVAYKWFKNGVEVSNLGYYSEGSSINDLLNPLDEFYVELTTDKGEVFHTSKAYPVLRNHKVKAYPNPANAGETVYVDIDMDSELLENGTIEVYNMLGIKVLSVKAQHQKTPVAIPNIPGTYILKLKADDFAKELRVIVK